jgi:hypothetical protein
MEISQDGKAENDKSEWGKNVTQKLTNDKNLKINKHEISLGMRFVYENYSKDCWYWEVIELVRKVILTSVLVYSGENGRLFLGISAIFSGFYSVFFANSKPIPYIFDHWLHLGSLLATMANQLMAMLLKIPVNTISTLVAIEDDSIGVTVLLVFANIFVMVMIAGKTYIYSLFQLNILSLILHQR